MIHNVIFDIGNVLTDFRWQDFLRDKGFDEKMVQRIGRASIENPLWAESDRGVMSDAELLEAFMKLDPEIEEELRLAYGDVHGMVTIRDYAIPWVRELKAKGYRVWYLSNFSRKAERECGDALAFIPYMDGGILSWKDKMIKPDPGIYRLLLDRYRLRPEECVFIDDTPVNIQAAEEQGIHGIVFRSREQTIHAMRELGMDV